MGFKVVPRGEGPPVSRNRPHLIEQTTEWRKLQEQLAKGLNPMEQIDVTFTEEEKKKLGLKAIRRVFRDVTKQYLEKHKMTHYSVFAFVSNGTDIIRVTYDPPMVKKRA